MPGSTSLGIVYPCGGDTIDAGVMATYATTTQQALTGVQDLVDQALRPPAASVRTDPAGQSIAAGVASAISYSLIMYDTAAFFSVGSPTILTIPEGGTYLVNVWFDRVSIPATLNSQRIAILVNGAERAYRKNDSGTTESASSPFFASAMLPSLVAGDQITTTNLFVGAGTMLVRHAVAVTKISNV